MSLYQIMLNDLSLKVWEFDDSARLDHASACEINPAIRALLNIVIQARSNEIEFASEAVRAFLALLFLGASRAIRLDEGRRVRL